MDWFLYDIGLRHERVNKEIPPHVFSCEFCEFFRNTFFVERLLLNNSHKKKAPIVLNIMINSLKGASFLIFLIVIPGGYF